MKILLLVLSLMLAGHTTVVPSTSPSPLILTVNPRESLSPADVHWFVKVSTPVYETCIEMDSDTGSASQSCWGGDNVSASRSGTWKRVPAGEYHVVAAIEELNGIRVRATIDFYVN